MAAAGPKGRDGPSPREFTTVRHFMMADLGLSGLPLLVYARIFGFCDAGCGYFESKGGLARFLNVQEHPEVDEAFRQLEQETGKAADRARERLSEIAERRQAPERLAERAERAREASRAHSQGIGRDRGPRQIEGPER